MKINILNKLKHHNHQERLDELLQTCQASQDIIERIKNGHRQNHLFCSAENLKAARNFLFFNRTGVGVVYCFDPCYKTYTIAIACCDPSYPNGPFYYMNLNYAKYYFYSLLIPDPLLDYFNQHLELGRQYTAIPTDAFYELVIHLKRRNSRIEYNNEPVNRTLSMPPPPLPPQFQ